MSALEEQLAQHIALVGLPEPQREYRFAPPRRWRADFAWPDRLLLVECEGGTRQHGRHNRHSGFEKDCAKYNAAVLLGYRVLRFTGDMVTSGEAIGVIEKALEEA